MSVWNAFFVVMVGAGVGGVAYYTGKFLSCHFKLRDIARNARTLPKPELPAVRRPEIDENWEADYGHVRHEE